MPLYHTHTQTHKHAAKNVRNQVHGLGCVWQRSWFAWCQLDVIRTHTLTHALSPSGVKHTHTLWSMRTCEAPLPISHAPRSLPHRNVASFSRVTWPLVASSGAPILYSSLWHKALNAVGIHWAATTLTPLTDIVDDIDPQWNVCLWHFTGQYSDKAPHHVPNT